jgi:integrase
MPDYRLVRFRGKFAVTWREGGRRFRHSLGVDSRAEADQRLARFIAARRAAGAVASGSAYTVADAWNGYTKALGAKPSAVTASHQWKAVAPTFAERNASTLTEDDCRRYIEARRGQGRSDSTIWSELSRLRSALKWAENKRLIDRAPKIWLPPPAAPRDKRLTREQVSAFIGACTLPHVKLFVILAATTGARMGAILSLTWNRVDLERGLIRYHDPAVVSTKKGRATTPINALAREALMEARKGATTPFVIEWAGQRVRSIKKGLATAGERAGTPWVTAHVFRHSAACILAEAGVPMAEIAQMLGHKDSRTTEAIYARFSPSYLRKAAATLEFA